MIEDTSKRDPIVHLTGAMGSAGLTGYVEDMERNGQAAMVTSAVLPTPTDPGPFEALGFTFGDRRDDLFSEATLPEGWTKDGSDHSMWSYVLDADGYRRVSIFYKAAFYDRRADMHIDRLPRTRAQAEAWSTDWADSSAWMSGDDRREGPNYVYCWKGRNDRYQDTGRRLEIEVAPDGSVVERRDFQA